MAELIAVIGSRKFPAMEDVQKYIMLLDPKTVIVSGDEVHSVMRPDSVDWIALVTAWRRGMNIVEIPANWPIHGRAAGFRRNPIIAEVADSCYAFWDGSSSGTKNTIDHFKRLGKPVEIRYPDGRYESFEGTDEASLLNWK